MRCDECRWWEVKETNYSHIPLVVSECLKPKPLWDCTDWKKDEKEYINRVLKEDCKDMLMFVQDGSDYRAHLYTKAEFFCASFEVLT